MIKAVHKFLNESISKNTTTDDFLLSNKKGGFFLNDDSSYKGLYFFENRLFKTLESIKLGPVKEIVNKFYCIERKYEKARDRMLFDDAFLYEVMNYNGKIEVIFDFGHSSNNKKEKYRIFNEESFVIVEYDGKYLAIKTDAKAEKIMKFRKRSYKDGIKREVYHGINLKINSKAKVVFSFSFDKEKAKKESLKLYNNSNGIIKQKAAYVIDLFKNSFNPPKDKKLKFAYYAALNSLDNLIIGEGVYAGFPDKLKVKTRDELISLKALIHMNKIGLAKEILNRNLMAIQDDGRLIDCFGSKKRNADSIGWLFKRIGDFLELVVNKGLASYYLDDKDAEFVRSKLMHSFENLSETYVMDYFLMNKANETWMDSITREGFRIEVQALFLSMFKTLRNLSHFLGIKNDKAEDFTEEISTKVKENILHFFFEEGYLLDGLEDPSLRPNIFLAHYICPDMLENHQWAFIFENSLPSLWLNFGLATVDKKSKLFGDNLHNGKSWYFLNNIAAMSLNTVDKETFRKYIKKILRKNINEVLFSGCIGSCPEYSSAFEPTSEGSRLSALNAATFIELAKEL